VTENKTRPTRQSVKTFLDAVEHSRRRTDAFTLLGLFNDWTGMKPVIWGNGLAGKSGSGIIGYGAYHYRYDSGREGDFFLTGFSPRKANTAIYVIPGFKSYSTELARLGPHKHSVSCLYLTNLENNDLSALEAMIRDSVKTMQERYEWKK